MALTSLTRCYCALICIFLLSGTAVSATVVKDLYSAKVPVQTQSMSERSSALEKAFTDVIVKVTGSSQFAKNEQAKDLAASAENYVQQFSFLKNNNPLQTDKPYLLKIDFVSKAINSLLLQHNIPVWGQDRPLTLFWIASKTDGKAELVGANSSNVIATLIDKDTDERGIPAILPLLDLTDLRHVSASDVEAPFMQTLQTAASRYGSNAMVVLRVKQQGKNIHSTWTLNVNDNLQNWRINGTDIQVIINQGVNDVADALAQQFAVQSQTQQSSINVTVTGLQSLSDFAQARDYLEKLAPVKSAAIEQINNNTVTYKVDLLGSLTDLQRVIKLDHTLQPEIKLDAGTATEQQLNYRWNP